MIALCGILLPVLARGGSPWLEEPGAQGRLAAGEILVRVDPDGKHVAAAVRIHAPAEVVWRVITDCENAPRFMPGMKACRRLAAAPDGSWETIEREFKYSWLMPSAHDIVRTEYHPPERIDFQQVSGDFRDERGAWVLSAAPASATTVLEYDFYIDLGFWLPHSLIQHSLRSELPAAMKAVRQRAEATHPQRAEP
ncbi:MAG: SRPBCC family protein [Proteobacteria bacterium]|nr:SRPBCC family protein [Pseudomonadota bacterium]